MSREGYIIETNLASAKLLGVGSDEFQGRPLANFLAPASQQALLGLLKKLRNDGTSASCEVQLSNDADGSPPLRIAANMAPGGEAILIVVSA